MSACVKPWLCDCTICAPVLLARKTCWLEPAQHVIVQCDSTYYCCFLLQAGESRIDFDALITRIAATRLQRLRKRLALQTECDIIKSFAIKV